MPDVFASGTARGATRLFFMHRPAASVTATRSTPRGLLRLVVDGAAGETRTQLAERARAQLDELERIAETVVQDWPRCDGETPSPAELWHRAGFADADVVAWLEAGVPWSTSAAELRRVGVMPRDVAKLAGDWTLGLVYARGEVSLAEVQALVVGDRVEEAHGS